MKKKLTVERLRELLRYDPDTGIFRWQVKRFGRTNIGDVAGTLNGIGYRQITIDYVIYLSHRLAWLYTYGVFTKDTIDHINGNPGDNRLSNLREASRKENQRNRRLNSNSSTGVCGVSWIPCENRYRARIRLNGKLIYLGQFIDKENAGLAYARAAKENYGEFYRK